MTFALYTDMALAADLPDEGLRRGDIVKLVDHHVAPDGSEASDILIPRHEPDATVESS